MKNRWNRFLGILGFVPLGFGLLGGVIAGSFTVPLVFGHLVVGLAFMLAWLVTGASGLMDLKGSIVGRGARFTGNLFLYAVVFLGILAVLNYFGARNDKRWDLTESGVNSLSKQSVSIIEGLKKPLKIVAIDAAGASEGAPAQELLELYQYHNPALVRTEVLNPRTKPQLLDTYGMKQGNLVYIEYGDGDKKGVSRLNEFNEEAVTNAIIKLTRGEARKIYYVQGHDELALDGTGPEGLKALSEAIDDEHLTVSGLLLSRAGTVPEDAAAVVLVSPKKPLLPQEKEMLIKYADGGGRLLLLTDPRAGADVREIAAHFGIEVGNNVVIDQVQRLFAGPTLGAQPMVTEYASHPITKNFSQQSITIFNIASTVKAVGKNDPTTTYTDLLKSSPTAWGETNLSGIFDSEDPTAILEENDVQGPVSLATVYEKKLESKKPDSTKSSDSASPEFLKTSRVVVVGDSDWVMNQNINVYANRDLILNMLNWVVGEEGGVTIRPRSMRASVAPIPRGSFVLLVAWSFVVPEILLAFGLYIWWRRRTLLA